MFWMTISIWLIAAGYFLILFAEYYYLPQMYGHTIAKPALRRHSADTIMVLAMALYGIYLALHNTTYLPLLLPLSVLAALLLAMLIRTPHWHLKQDGFIYLFRFIPYTAITQMTLSQTGELCIMLNTGGKISIRFKNIAAVETAASFFANEQHLQQILISNQNTPTQS